LKSKQKTATSATCNYSSKTHVIFYNSVAVVGLPHDIDGEHPLAFVVLRPEHQAKAEELIQFTNGNLVLSTATEIPFTRRINYQMFFSNLERVIDEEKLRGGVRFIDKIPRNELGKIMRPQLVKLL